MTPFRAAMAGWSVIREALIYRGRPNQPGPGLAVPWMVSRRFGPPGKPQEVSSPGCVTGITVGFGAPGILNVANRKVAPASSEIIIWMKSWSALLKCRNGMYREPVIWSTTGLVNVKQFCGWAGFASAAGA